MPPNYISDLPMRMKHVSAELTDPWMVVLSRRYLFCGLCQRRVILFASGTLPSLS